jgi:hypothetical protein
MPIKTNGASLREPAPATSAIYPLVTTGAAGGGGVFPFPTYCAQPALPCHAPSENQSNHSAASAEKTQARLSIKAECGRHRTLLRPGGALIYVKHSKAVGLSPTGGFALQPLPGPSLVWATNGPRQRLSNRPCRRNPSRP